MQMVVICFSLQVSMMAYSLRKHLQHISPPQFLHQLEVVQQVALRSQTDTFYTLVGSLHIKNRKRRAVLESYFLQEQFEFSPDDISFPI